MDFTNKHWGIFHGMAKEQIILCPKQKWGKEPIVIGASPYI
jgi:hypothetical protein